jgi:geranylgeranyl transferase type-2 subunit alpha
VQEIIVNDLKLIFPLLILYPKCYWIWNYRMWLLEQAQDHLAQTVVRQIWQEELELVGKMLSRDERNFHGWSYRRHVVSQLEGLMGPDEGSLVEQEFAYTSKMIKAKLQNFSALHNRSQLLPRLLEERKADGSARRRMLEAELDMMQEALVDPYNQSAWFYHQYLMSTISLECPRESAIVLDLTPTERIKHYEQEIERIAEIEEDIDDCKWVFEALLQYSVDLQKLGGETESSQQQQWLDTLLRLDPMRAGRWKDLRADLKL